jgi:hypothetical protein
MKRILWALGVLALLLLAYAGYNWRGGAQTPAGQISLTDLDRRGLSVFEQMFDDAGGRVRVVGLFSPT